jgi:hypothetical protein
VEAAHIHRFGMDETTRLQAKTLTAAVLTAALGRRLATWEAV